MIPLELRHGGLFLLFLFSSFLGPFFVGFYGGQAREPEDYEWVGFTGAGMGA